MSVQAHHCHPDRIAGFLDRSLSDSELAALEDHLGECSTCRKLLGDQTAAAELWDKASRYLRDDQDEPDLLSGASDLSPAQDHSHAIQAVLDSLCPTDDPEMLGRLGGLEVAGVVGAGAMGVVLKVFDNSLDRTVAVKVLAPHLASSGAARKRFAREAKAAAAVLHPNVMAIHSVSNDESLPYLVMPYFRGTSLQKRLDQEGPLTPAEILRIGSQIAAGLAAAHAQGLIHRDIKPANILLEEGVERVAITDFGLARAVDDATMTRTGVIVGTPLYMSPEQARGESLDQRSDLFSLGSVLYAMCTGRSPFRAETSYGVLRRITDEEPRPIREINPDIPQWFCVIVAKLMSKRPDDRFESAEQLAELLEDCLAHVQQPTTAPLPVLHGHRPSPPIGRRGWWPAATVLMGAAFAFVIMLAGILIVLELNQGTLTIKCDTDSVPVRITQGDKVVEEMIVARDEQSVRIAAGRYEVELLSETDGLVIKDGTFTLTRGQEHVVTITRVEPKTPLVGRAAPSKSEGASVETQRADVLQIVGVLDYDERRIAYVHTRLAGRIEKLHVDYRGVEVSKGDPLVTLYSSELYTAEEEFLLVHMTNEAQSSPQNARLLDSARERLRLFGLNNEQIDELAKRNKATGRLILFAPSNGIVTAMEAQEGGSVKSGTRLFTIADPARLWASLYVNEAHFGLFRFDQRVTLTAHAYPGQTFSGKILFIEPLSDPKTRAIAIRVDVSNPESKLKAGMSVTASVRQPMAHTDRDADLDGRLDLEKRRVVLSQLVKVQTEAYRQGEASIEGMVQSYQELVQIDLELAATDDERITLLEKSVELARDLEKIATAKYQAAQASQADVLKARAIRLKAETDLLHERQKAENN